MIDILVRGSHVFTGDELVRDGYVYIKDGVVEDIGSGLPPEDYTYATIIVGGRGRIVVPGLLAPLDLVGYALRTPRCEPLIPQSCGARARVDSRSEVTLSLPAVLEAHLRGITRILALTPMLETLISLQDKTGGSYGMILPSDCSGAPKHPRLEAVVRLGVEVERAYPCPGEFMAGDSPFQASLELAGRLGLRPPRIAKGDMASIVVFNLERPPLFGLEVSTPEDAGLVYRFGATAETVIHGQDILVDAGGHLMIVEKHLNEALKVRQGLLGAIR